MALFGLQLPLNQLHVFKKFTRILLFVALVLFRPIGGFTPTGGLSSQTIRSLVQNRFGDDLLKGKVIVITGATGGLGRELCRVCTDRNLAAKMVVALDVNEEALKELQRELTTTSSSSSSSSSHTQDDDDDNNNLQTIVADHSNLDSVAVAAATILQSHDKIDLLVNNAGIWYPFDDAQVERADVSAQGYDLLFSINYLSGFLLTQLLLPAMRSGNDGGARMVHVVSTKHWQVDGSSLLPNNNSSSSNNNNSSNPVASRSGKDRIATHVEDSYANSKLAQLWHARALSRKSNGLQCVCACPSWAATGIAGDHPNGEVLTKFAYATQDCGPAITSTLNAMFRTEEELKNCIVGDATTYVANSRVWTNLLPPWKQLWVTSKVVAPFRSRIVAFCTTVILLTQRWFHDDFILQETSPESCDMECQDAFYEWSLEAVKPWL
ncbi:MAG: hypothetical protein SGILL_005638 [Bacillariaceae sp.]